jgi:hypothetical protein
VLKNEVAFLDEEESRNRRDPPSNRRSSLQLVVGDLETHGLCRRLILKAGLILHRMYF